MKGAKADEAAFPHPGASGGMTTRQVVALEFAKALVGRDGVGTADENDKTIKRAFILTDLFLAAQENTP